MPDYWDDKAHGLMAKDYEEMIEWLQKYLNLPSRSATLRHLVRKNFTGLIENGEFVRLGIDVHVKSPRLGKYLKIYFEPPELSYLSSSDE